MQFIDLGLDVLLNLNERAAVRSSDTEEHVHTDLPGLTTCATSSDVDRFNVTVDGSSDGGLHLVIETLQIESVAIERNIIVGEFMPGPRQPTIGTRLMIMRYLCAFASLILLVHHDDEVNRE